MSSKRHVRRKACGNKRRFPDEKAAKNAAFLTHRASGTNMQPYHCRFCGAYHIGHYGRRDSWVA